jgi:ABC-type multidrug transport system fused ATPase/permease subunit
MSTTVEYALRVLAGVAGGWLVITTVSGAIRSFVLPRSESVRLNAFVFGGVRALFDFAARRATTYARRDRILAHYAPVALVALPIGWLALVGVGYSAIYWALGVEDFTKSYELSGSSLLTLGTTSESGLAVNIFSYSEATIGLLLLTLLISYLPTLYQAFSRREIVVAQVELRAGIPATAAGLLVWLGPDFSRDDDTQWLDWEKWLVEIDESHTSLPVLAFFRSPQGGRSWVTTASLILDAANLHFSALDAPASRQVETTFKAGVLALNRVHRFFDHTAETEPAELRPPEEQAADAPGRLDFAAAWRALRDAGLPLRASEEAAWQHYADRRRRYAPAQEFLNALLMTPPLER